MDFGHSGPYQKIYAHFGLTDAMIAGQIEQLERGNNMSIRIAINGFGRIGRNIVRALYAICKIKLIWLQLMT